MGGAVDVKGVYSRESLSQYLGEGLGYRVTDVSYPSKQLNIPPKPSEAIQSVRLLSDYNKAFQVYLLETTSLTRTTVRSILSRSTVITRQVTTFLSSPRTIASWWLSVITLSLISRLSSLLICNINHNNYGGRVCA